MFVVNRDFRYVRIYICGRTSTRMHLIRNVGGVKGADTPPTHTPTQNDLLVAMHMVYLVLLIVELFSYVDE